MEVVPGGTYLLRESGAIPHWLNVGFCGFLYFFSVFTNHFVPFEFKVHAPFIVNPGFCNGNNVEWLRELSEVILYVVKIGIQASAIEMND